jgi:hypothetical protein
MEPQPVKVFVGVLTASLSSVKEVTSLLEQHLGSIDTQSPVLEFDFTDYYEREMGPGLKRIFLGFARLVIPDSLVHLKLFTNRLEQNLAVEGKRTANIDPGYLAPARVVLASTKDFAHRLYLGKGIYGEITLMYQKKDFLTLPWTYPDYRSEAYRQFFRELRQIYMAQLGTPGNMLERKDFPG